MNRTINDLTLSARVPRTTRTPGAARPVVRAAARPYSQRMPALAGTVPSTK